MYKSRRGVPHDLGYFVDFRRRGRWMITCFWRIEWFRMVADKACMVCSLDSGKGTFLRGELLISPARGFHPDWSWIEPLSASHPFYPRPTLYVNHEQEGWTWSNQMTQLAVLLATGLSEDVRHLSCPKNSWPHLNNSCMSPQHVIAGFSFLLPSCRFLFIGPAIMGIIVFTSIECEYTILSAIDPFI